MAVAIATAAGVTDAVARFALDYRASAEALERAQRAVLDTIGVTVAGGVEPCFAILAETLGAPPGRGEATVLPTRERTSAAHAAFLNGTAGHALDFDDVADELKGHPSVVLVSALLPVAEARGRSGQEFLQAYCAGFEIACAIARAFPVNAHYRNGWHSTATVGVLAAAAGVGRLLGLDLERLRNALGIAASMAGGSRQNFGTMTKPLHAGLAARDAVLAAELAANGFTADQEQLEGPVGYFRQYGVASDLARVGSSLAAADVLETQGINVKKFPCCFGAHRPADAALDLYARGVRGDSVRAVRVAVEPGGTMATIHHRPTTGLQGKFSTEYVVAVCLLDGAVKLSTFTDQAVTRAEAQDLLRRVSVEETPEPPVGSPAFEHSYATIEVTLNDGSAVQARCDVPRGDGRAPLSDAELEAKFRDCLDFAHSAWDTDALLAHVTQLRAADRAMRW